MDEHLDRKYLEVELYEKNLVRERRKKLILISLAFTVFLFLCGMPVFNERLPKWESLKAARKIAVEIEKLKTESLQLKKPLLLSVLDNGQVKVEEVGNCGVGSGESFAIKEKLHEVNWMDPADEIGLLNQVDAKKLNLNFAVQQICFDPVSGVSSPKVKKVFVVAPVKDLAESRLDRASYIEIDSTSARISIN